MHPGAGGGGGTGGGPMAARQGSQAQLRAPTPRENTCRRRRRPRAARCKATPGGDAKLEAEPLPPLPTPPPLRLVTPKLAVPPAWQMEFQTFLGRVTQGRMTGRLDLEETGARSAASTFDAIAQGEAEWRAFQESFQNSPVAPPPPPPPKRGTAAWSDLMLMTDAYLPVAKEQGWLEPIGSTDAAPAWWSRLPEPLRGVCTGESGTIIAAPYRMTHVVLLTKPSALKRILGKDAPPIDYTTLLDPRLRRRFILPSAPAVWRDVAQRAMEGKAGDARAPLHHTTRTERAAMASAMKALRTGALVAAMPKPKQDGKMGKDAMATEVAKQYDAEVARSLLSGDAAVAVLDASSAVALSRRYPGLELAPVSESLGTMLCMDAWVRPRCAHVRLGDLAEPWLDFLAEPQRCTSSGRYRGASATQGAFSAALSPYTVAWGDRKAPGNDLAEPWIPTPTALARSALAPPNTREDAVAWREVLDEAGMRPPQTQREL